MFPPYAFTLTTLRLRNAQDRLESTTGYVADSRIQVAVDSASVRLEQLADESWLAWGRRLLPNLARASDAAKLRAAQANDSADLYAEGKITVEEYLAACAEAGGDDEDGEIDVDMDDDGSKAEENAGKKGKAKEASPIPIEDQTAGEFTSDVDEETPVETPKRPARAKGKAKSAAVTVKKERPSGKVDEVPVAVRPIDAPCAVSSY